MLNIEHFVHFITVRTQQSNSVFVEHFNIKYYCDYKVALWLACTAMYREPACFAQFVE